MNIDEILTILEEDCDDKAISLALSYIIIELDTIKKKINEGAK